MVEKLGELRPPVTGQALIDTGAAVTCVDRAAAEAAGLVPVDSGFITSATHESEPTPIYACQIDFTGSSVGLTQHRAVGAHLAPQGLVALIGRDALSSCILIYNGIDGSVSLSL